MNNFFKFLSFISKWTILWLLVVLVVLPCERSLYIAADTSLPVGGWPDIPRDNEPKKEEEEEPQEIWRQNIMPETEEKIFLTWSYRPTTWKNPPPGVNVAAPTWFYVEDPDNNGVPQLLDITEMGRKADLKKYVDLAHKDNVKVWGTVVSFNADLSDALIHTPEYKEQFIEKLKGFVSQYNLDGINFDFEYMNPAHKLDYTQFIKDCADALRPMGITISVDVVVKLEYETSTNWYQCYDHKSLGEVVDYMAVMSWGEHGAFSEPGSIATIAWLEKKIQGILEDVPSNKVLMGIPFFSYDFPSWPTETMNTDILAPAWSPKGSEIKVILKSYVDKALTGNAYNDVNGKKIIIKSWLVHNEWDDNEDAYYLKFMDQDNVIHEIWYEESRSMALKTKLVHKYHLAGVAIWQQSYSQPAFWESIQQELQK